jgi:chromosome segregation ATPase
MARAKESPRGGLATLQDFLTGGGQIVLDQASQLRDGVQRALEDVGRGVETQLAGAIDVIGDQVIQRVDAVVAALTARLRDDVEELAERQELLEARFSEQSARPIEDVVESLRALITGVGDSVSEVQHRVADLGNRLQHVERRAAELTRETTQETIDAEELRHRITRLDQRLTDLGREVGAKLTELSAARERLTRVEARVLETSKEQIARAGEGTALRDRLARLEARLTDLSREQVARAVEAAGLRERVFRMEQRTATTPSSNDDRSHLAAPILPEG